MKLNSGEPGFDLEHPAQGSCLINEGNTFVLTGELSLCQGPIPSHRAKPVYDVLFGCFSLLLPRWQRVKLQHWWKPLSDLPRKCWQVSGRRGFLSNLFNHPTRVVNVKNSCLREASPFQNGWIFGKVPNGLWPPPSFSENHIADFS